MSDILCRWLNNELRLSKTVERNTLAKDFSSGYLFGEVLHKYQLQDDFSMFINSNISSSKVSNLHRIEPSFHLLGVPFDQKTAQALMQEQQGAATHLLHQLYILLKQRTSKGSPVDTAQPTAGGSRLNIKETNLYSAHRHGTKSDAELKLSKLSQHYEEKARPLKERAEMAELLQEQKLLVKDDVRLKDMEKLRLLRRRQTELTAGIQASIVHDPKPPANKLMQIQHQQQQLRREQQRQVTAEIAQFDRSRKVMGTSDLSYFSSGKTLTGGRKAVSSNAPNIEYLQRIRQRLAEESASCQQRERRRSTFLQEQHKALEAQQNAQRDEQLVRRLTRQTKEERRLEVQLLQIRAQKEVIRENRLFRERQYQEQRERDLLVALEREAILAQQAKLDEADVVTRQLELHHRMAAERAQHKKEKHSKVCLEVLDQIVDLATKVGEYRLLTGKLIPGKMMREWKELLLNGLPLYDAGAGDSDAGPLSAPQDPLELQKQELLNTQDLNEYTNMAEEWVWPEVEGEAKRPLGNNSILQHVVLRLRSMVSGAPPVTPPPLFPQFTLKACVLGKPCSGKSTCLAKLAQAHGFHIISADTLIQEALDAHQSGEKSIYQGASLVTCVQIGDAQEFPSIVEGQGSEVTEGEGLGSPALEAALDQQQDMAKRESSARALCGAAAEQMMRTGQRIPDELVVNLIVEAIRLVPAASGWVLDGFPASVSQAHLLELALGGSLTVPTTAPPRGWQRLKAALARDPSTAKKPPPPVLDLVLLLDVPDEVLLAHAVHQSRGEDPAGSSSGPDGCTGTGAKAFSPPDIHLRTKQIQNGIFAFQDNWSKLDKWYNGNQGILVRLDADVSEEVLFSSVESVMLQALMNKPPVFEGGPPDPTPPGTSPQQDPNVDTSGSTTSPRPRSSSKSPRVRTPGRSRTPSVSLHPTRETGSPMDRRALRLGSARWVYVEEALQPEITGALLSYWETISQSYLSNIKTVMQNLRTERNIIIHHLFNIREEYKHYLSRPDLKQEFVSQFQQDFNSSIPEDMREDTDTKAELHLRLDELRERLWDMGDKRREENGREKTCLVDSGWLEDHTAVLANHYVTLMQVELNRFQGTLGVLRDYYLGMCRAETPCTPTPFTCLPLVDATDSRDPAPLQGESTDQAAQSAGAIEEGRVAQRTTQVIPLLDRNTSYVATEHVSFASQAALDAIKNMCEQAYAVIQLNKVEVVEGQKEKNTARGTSARGTSARGTSARGSTAKRKGPPPTPPTAPTPLPPVKESSEEIRLREIRAKIHKEFTAALGHEVQAVETHVSLVRGCALLSIRSLQRRAEETFSCMNQWLASHYLSQSNSIDRLAEVVRHHIELGSQLHNELVLESTDFYVNGDLLMVASRPRPPRPPTLETPAHATLSVAQLEFLHTQLCIVAPSGLLSWADFTNVLQDFISLRMGPDCLPEAWTSMSEAQVMEVVSLLTLESQAVDWRRFLLSAALPWPLPTLAQLLLLLQGFRDADTGATGSVDRDQYLQVELWFPSETAQPVPEDPSEPLPFDRLANLRKLFFQMFADHSSSPPRLDYARMLGYLAAHPEPAQGFVRALSLVLGRPLRHPSASCFVKSMPNINKAPEPVSPGRQAQGEVEEADEVVPWGSSGWDGEQGVSIPALLAVLCHGDIHKTGYVPCTTPEELTEDLQHVFGELGYGPQEHVPFSVLCHHPVVQGLMERSTCYQLIDIMGVLKSQASESETQVSTAS